jgi:hypothetical protein
MKARTYEDLTDISLYIASEVARGTVGPQIAHAIKQMLEIAFTSIAASNRGAENSQASTAISSLVQAMQDYNSTPKTLPTYTVFEVPAEQEAVVIDISIGNKA